MLLAKEEALEAESSRLREELSCTLSVTRRDRPDGAEAELDLELAFELDFDDEGVDLLLERRELELNDEAFGREGRDMENEGPRLLPVANAHSFPVAEAPHPIDYKNPPPVTSTYSGNFKKHEEEGRKPYDRHRLPRSTE